jgi:hypothetical protein
MVLTAIVVVVVVQGVTQAQLVLHPVAMEVLTPVVEVILFQQPVPVAVLVVAIPEEQVFLVRGITTHKVEVV